MKVILETYRTH